MSKRTWSDEAFIQAVKNNISIMGVLQEIGLRPTNGNYTTVKKYATKFNLNTSHWLGQRSGLGKPAHNKQELDSILIEKSSYKSNVHLRKRLIESNLLPNHCANCKITEWNSKPIILQLDHVNGIHHDNRLDNLRLLCPNCHSQTPTFCGRNKHR